VFPLNLYARVRLLLPIAHETAGAARTRSSLRPLFRWRDNEMQTFGRNASRDRLRIFHCRHPRRRV